MVDPVSSREGLEENKTSVWLLGVKVGGGTAGEGKHEQQGRGSTPSAVVVSPLSPERECYKSLHQEKFRGFTSERERVSLEREK